MSAGLSAGTNPGNPNKSFEVVQPPTDGVSSLSFSPKGNYLVATSWDNQVRCWEVNTSGGSVPKASISHDQPVLCSAWKDDGTTVFSAGCDKQAKMWPLMAGGQATTVAMHDAPIKEIAWIPEMNVLVTGSWDKTLRYWDTRQSTPVHTQQLPDRCYAITVRHPLMVVGTADRNLVVFNLQNPQAEFKRITSPLKYQTRCVAAFPDKQGFLVGSIEGRVGVHHLDDGQQSKNFTFKCHREGNEIYSVNSLNFHPIHHTFATAGSDGAFNFWDKDSKQRLKVMPNLVRPDFLNAQLDLDAAGYWSVRRWQGATSLYHAALSIVMAPYLHMRFVMTGVKGQKITILQQRRHIFYSTCHRNLKLKESRELEQGVDSFSIHENCSAVL